MGDDCMGLSQQIASTVAVIFGAFGAVWAASGAMNSVIKAANAAYERMETRPFWKVRITSVTLVLASGFAFAALFLLIVFGGPTPRSRSSSERS